MNAAAKINTGNGYKNVGLRPDLHRTLIGAMPGMKMGQRIAALLAGWRMLSLQQRAEAITGARLGGNGESDGASGGRTEAGQTEAGQTETGQGGGA